MSPVPEMMKVVEITEFGGPDVLKLGERPIPSLNKGEVLIKVAAAGVNRPDCIQRSGAYPPPPGASDIPGLEVAGEIVSVADDVDASLIGKSICALVAGGGYGEYCSAHASLCMPIPHGFSPVEAAALPETFFTVWFNLFHQGGLKAGQSLLVHGGSSGIGTTAIQMANKRGVRVLTTAGNAEKLEVCKTLGADVLINYRAVDFVEAVNVATDKKGVDMILDMVGGDYIAKNIKCLARGGRLINIAYLQGSKAEVNFMTVMLKQLTLTGSTLRPQSVSVKATLADALKQEVWPLLDQGEIKPIIHKVFAMDEAAKAHSLMESSQHIGKIILQIS